MGGAAPEYRKCHVSTETPLRDYQHAAVEAIAQGLKIGGRGQLHAACGSGKTLMSVHAGLRLAPSNGLIVVLVPSLALTSQTITVWRSHARLDAVLAVCSEDTTTDAPVHLPDIPAHTTTTPDQIAGWVSQHGGLRLIVGTYQSAGRIAEALHQHPFTIDLLICDEAHHLTGRPDYVTRRVLEDDYLPARRRLFMTATPRTDDQRAASTGSLTMSDTIVFGPVLYRYSFARAISEGYLDDYRIVVMGVTESQVWEMLRAEGVEYVESLGGPDIKSVVAQALIAKAARTWGLRRILAFCRLVDEAEEFAASLPRTVAALPADARPEGDLYSGKVTGKMSHTQRDQVLNRLRQPPGEWSVIANVRCLGEGVDVPAVDAVAFTRPKQSQVDIIQAAGRALRRSPGGTGTATIIVPIIIPDSDEEIGDLDPGEYRVLWQVVRAMRAHDEHLGAELDTQPRHDPTHNPGLPDKITIEVPPGTSQRVVDQIKALTVQQTTSVWWQGYHHAHAYHREHGHLEVPSTHVTQNGFRLGRWIANTRQQRRKGWLSSDRVDALERIGMVWDTRTASWSRFLQEVEKYKAHTGHLNIPQEYVSETGYRLGLQVNRARTHPHTIPAHIVESLDDLGMVWNTNHARWQQVFNAAQEYVAEHGHLRVPSTYRTTGGVALGSALKARRARARAGTLDPAEHHSLDELDPQWAVDADELAWEEMLAACDRYVAGHESLAGITKDYVDDEGYALGARISYYRTLNNGTKGPQSLSADRKKALEERGMVWRLAPTRDITAAEGDMLKRLSGVDLGQTLIGLVDAGVTQKSLAMVLGVHRSYLNAKIKRFREKGEWAARKSRSNT